MDSPILDSSLNLILSEANSIIDGLLAILNAIAIYWLIHFIINVELPSKRLEPSFKNIFTVFNALLLGMWLCIFVFHVSCGVLEYSAYRNIPAFACTWVSFGLIQTCYVWYSWSRSEQILKKRTRPLTLRLFKSLLLLLPFLSLGAIYDAFKMVHNPTYDSRIYLTLAIASGIITSSLDFFFVWSFSNHMRAGEDDTQVLDISLNIIAKFGYRSASVCMLTLFLFLGAFICLYIQPQLQGTIATVYFVFWGLKGFGLAGMVYTCVSMKMALFKQANIVRQSVKEGIDQQLSRIKIPSLESLNKATSRSQGLGDSGSGSSFNLISSERKKSMKSIKKGSSGSLQKSKSMADVLVSNNSIKIPPSPRMRKPSSVLSQRPISFNEVNVGSAKMSRTGSIASTRTRPKSLINIESDSPEPTFLTEKEAPLPKRNASDFGLKDVKVEATDLESGVQSGGDESN
ncbi:hypothetical protein BCR33DRAFT_723335 [Rhizoclosmatium globosum]|uniref:Transmembrane protein n=1 Tax=Rhizoclosmatium globosum TaxID=329046 RepID=A0A1Y2BDU9_9FUNG|nr:hypothetical protein BCR33DRAFT_723335 [Rhizoclosmatium globosum]|eukprot:ORY32992.1 hypothetical protein BCR33DRAFT_723335 [Rhizoclosmatium globosum]